MKTNTLLVVAAVTLLALATSATAGTVYRWVDGDGNVQFSETPPPGHDAETTEYRTGSSAPQQPQTADEAPPEDADEQPELDATEDAAEQPEVDAETLARRHERRCEAAREGLQIIEENPRLRIEEDGEYRFLEPDEIDARRQEYQEAADESCGWSAN